MVVSETGGLMTGHDESYDFGMGHAVFQSLIQTFVGALSRWAPSFALCIFALASGIAFWAHLIGMDRQASLPTAKLLRRLLGFGLMLRVVFALCTPTFYAPDERLHYCYLLHLDQFRSFPVKGLGQPLPEGFPPPHLIPNEPYDGEFTQPPLYYLLLLPLHRFAALFDVSDPLAVRYLRLCNVILWLTGAILVLRALRRLNLSEEFIGVFVMAMVCLLPSYVFLTSMINNDNLLFALGCLIIFLAASEQCLRHSVLMGIALGCSLLTKMHGLSYLLIPVTVAAVDSLRRRGSLRILVVNLFIAILLTITICAPWAIRNVMVYSDLTGVMITQPVTRWTSAVGSADTVRRNITQTFWSASGLTNNVRFLPVLGAHLWYLSLLGWGWRLLRRPKSSLDRLEGDRISLWIGIGASIAANLVMAVVYGFLYGQPQGRYLFPSLFGIGLFTAMGLDFLGVRQRIQESRAHVVGFFATYAFCFTVYSLILFPHMMRS